MNEKKIREQLESNWRKREDILKGKSRTTNGENKRYNMLGREILKLRRMLYSKRE